MFELLRFDCISSGFLFNSTDRSISNRMSSGYIIIIIIIIIIILLLLLLSCLIENPVSNVNSVDPD